MPNYLGQHFLKNGAVIAKIIAALDLHAGETIIEIGPGHGELTIPLATAAAKVGAKIIAVEKDEKLAEALRARIAVAGKKENDGSVEIVHGDILEFLKTAKFTTFKLVGNIPYYLTGHLLRIVSELDGELDGTAAKPERVVLMIQKEVADRLAAEPPKMNRLAASVQFWAEPKIIARVPRADFSPPPEVDSAVVQLIAKTSSKKNAVAESKKYYATVRALFAQPRKTVFNNLRAAKEQEQRENNNPRIPDKAHSKTPDNKATIEMMLLKLGIDPKSRPQDLTVALIQRIAKNSQI
jgi:16S rRNA (adenine1518-N6/adenine1519-N6)-dimethyltransferase